VTSALRPDSAQGVLDAVSWAAADEIPLEILGHGSRRGVGRPVQAEHTLDLSGLSGVTLYEPEELVLSACAGTPMAEIEKLLRDANQAFAFEPMDCGPLFGQPRGQGTIGGVLASNACGPRRIKAGAARDHVLGIHAVSGRGEAFKSGGRVVKNVTGYDLSKGLAGSWGTLAVVTEVTFKVLPRPEYETTLVLSGLDDARAVAVLCEAMGTPWDVSGAAHLPADVASAISNFPGGGRGATLIRLEGFPPSVDYRAEKLKSQFEALDLTLLEPDASERLWRTVRDAEVFGGLAGPVWRVSVAPTAGPGLVAALQAQHAIIAYYDWSGGLIWIAAADERGDGLAGPIRAAVAACGGGHATLMRGSPALRTAVRSSSRSRRRWPLYRGG
jgi:glycolate oxidase FAD binding subunit